MTDESFDIEDGASRTKERTRRTLGTRRNILHRASAEFPSGGISVAKR